MQNKLEEQIPILIYGTSERLVRWAAVLNKGEAYRVAGFISPEKEAEGKRIQGLPVYTDEAIRAEISTQRSYRAILINPLEMERGEKLRLSDLCLENGIDLLSAPRLNAWDGADPAFVEIRKATIEDLLGRIPIAIDTDSIARNLAGKVVMITGAAGSIGNEIVRQLTCFDTQLLLLCDNAETPVYELCLELDENYPDTAYKAKICDVQNYRQMKHIIEKYRPDYIYHAAAYKHVPLMEDHPCEAVLTNVLGTKNLVDLAVANQVEAFVMISTDKAVNPSNVMGASKRLAEIYVQSLSQQIAAGADKTRIITTRFGNVMGSSGSVIPYFRKQIEQGGPVTVTHPDIIRYFMTLSEACRLVLEAGNFGKGGEVFLFDMGDPVKIKDLAERMIALSGVRPYRDIDIVYTGLRPGEKLYEELLYNKETVIPTHNKKIVIGSVEKYDFEYVQSMTAGLIELAGAFDKDKVLSLMKTLIPELKNR